MIRNSVLEHVAPAVGERPEHGRDMGAHRLTFRPRRAFAAAALELGEHRLVGDGGRINVAYSRL
jgi:hypothetical protein